MLRTVVAGQFAGAARFFIARSKATAVASGTVGSDSPKIQTFSSVEPIVR